jgi:anti-anti-sigma factor
MSPTVSREPAVLEARTSEAESRFELMVLPAGRMALATVLGALDLSHTARFLEPLRNLSNSCRRLVVDLRRTEFVDSDGVRALLQLRELLQERGTELRLVAPVGGRVRRTLDLLRLGSQFGVYDRLMDAWIDRPVAA